MAKTYDENGNEIKVDKKTEEARKAAFAQISKKAILVNMVRRQISNMPFDVQLTNDICDHLGVKDHDMLQIRKFLFNPQHLAKIRSLINDALLLVWNHTRPWDNIGYRLLPMQYYDDFNETFGKIKDEFEVEVKAFIDNYDDYVAESKKNLGKAFNKKDYPDKAQLSDIFSLEIETTEFPDIDDIRLNLSGPELLEMQKEITDKFNDTVNAAMEELIKLVESDHTNANVPTLIKLVESLNINSDSAINMKLAEIKDQTNFKESDTKPESMMVMDDLADLNDIDDSDSDSDDLENLPDLI